MRLKADNVLVFCLVLSSFVTLLFHWPLINIIPQIVLFIVFLFLVTNRVSRSNISYGVFFVILSFLVFMLSSGGGWQASLKLLNAGLISIIFSQYRYSQYLRYFIIFVIFNSVAMVLTGLTGVSIALDSDIYFRYPNFPIHANAGLLKEMNYSGILAGLLAILITRWLKTPVLFISIFIATSRISFLIPLLYFVGRLLKVKIFRFLLIISPILISAYIFEFFPGLLLERYYLWEQALKVLKWNEAIPLSNLTEHMLEGNPNSPWKPKSAVHSGIIENMILNGPIVFITIFIVSIISALRMNLNEFLVFIYLYLTSFVMSLSLGGLSATSMLYTWLIIKGLRKNER
jgi:hypothetical protein